MRNKKAICIAIIVCGLVLMFTALFADLIGIGDVDPDHFVLGKKQIAGAILGGVIAAAGILYWKKT